MTIQQLIDKLSQLPPNSKIMILDGFNGGGNPRTINFGPTEENEEENEEESSDCENRGGEITYVIGYGCY